jgi:nucleoside-diphosphate-sugar epimerase
MNSRIILTGSTGMVGEGVLHECILDNEIEKILVINRRTLDMRHPKVQELVIPDFFDLSQLNGKLSGYDAVFFCLGVSSVGMSQDKYYKMTYELTIQFANMVASQNANLEFCYISGAGTDSTENGRLAWARVKGKTENDLMKIPFKRAYNFRPGVLTPTKGLKNTLGFYKWLGWMIPIIKLFASNRITSLSQLGRAMIQVVKHGYEKQVIEVKDILLLNKE